MNNDYRLQIIKENFSQNEGDETLREYTEREAENDPLFFNWFFGNEAENINAFGLGMTEKQRIEYTDFLKVL